MRRIPFGQVAPMPPGDQTVILDKSAFQEMGRDDHIRMFGRYRLNILPVLLREILADLSLQNPKIRQTPDQWVRSLAKKFLGSGDPINVEARKLCYMDLNGHAFTDGFGRTLIEDYTLVRDPAAPDGPPAVMIDPGPANFAIIRWADAEFTEAEQRIAAGIRTQSVAFSLDQLNGRLRAHSVLIPRPKDIPDLAHIADDMLRAPGLQRAFLEWVVEQVGVPLLTRPPIYIRWEEAGRPLLETFAPYAHHVTRILLMLLIGTKHNKLSNRPTNRIDAEYLFYSPFCHLFVSSDSLHRQLAPFALWPGQRFATTKEFKEELGRPRTNDAPR